MLDRRPPRAENRWRRYRARPRAGLAVVPVETDSAIVGLLVELCWLDERDAATAHSDRTKRFQGLALSNRCWSARWQHYAFRRTVKPGIGRSSILAAGPK
jgi:hypothetical protein